MHSTMRNQGPLDKHGLIGGIRHSGTTSGLQAFSFLRLPFFLGLSSVLKEPCRYTKPIIRAKTATTAASFSQLLKTVLVIELLQIN